MKPVVKGPTLLKYSYNFCSLISILNRINVFCFVLLASIFVFCSIFDKFFFFLLIIFILGISFIFLVLNVIKYFLIKKMKFQLTIRLISRLNLFLIIITFFYLLLNLEFVGINLLFFFCLEFLVILLPVILVFFLFFFICSFLYKRFWFKECIAARKALYPTPDFSEIEENFSDLDSIYIVEKFFHALKECDFTEDPVFFDSDDEEGFDEDWVLKQLLK